MMGGWMKGETVTVIRSSDAGVDRLGEPIRDEVAEDVENVLVSQSTSDELDATRPGGASIDAVLAFPKTYEGELRGAHVVVRGRRARVVGDPWRVPLSPLPWDLKVEVVFHEG